MKKSFLEYYKMILEKVSFDKYLFIKEYKKALRAIEKHEAEQLSRWMQEQDLYSELLGAKTTDRF